MAERPTFPPGITAPGDEPGGPHGSLDARLFADVARSALAAGSRVTHRQAVLAALCTQLPCEFGFLVGPPAGRAEVVSWQLPETLARLVRRHARATWAELRVLDVRARGGVAVLNGSSRDSPLLRLLGLGAPMCQLVTVVTGEDGTAFVLGLRPGVALDELALRRLRELVPVLELADSHTGSVEESLGAPLSTREREIFELLRLGYTNRQIATAIGTSPLTVRNQLARLFRKVGVASRSELVGLAAQSLRLESRGA